MIDHLEAAHGPLTFFQSGGCCDGASPMCLKRDELPISPNDLLLGEIGGTPFHIDGDLYERWGKPHFLIDVAAGAAEGFSLEGLEGVHFVRDANTVSPGLGRALAAAAVVGEDGGDLGALPGR